MKNILGLFLGAFAWINILAVSAAEKFDILPDLPEPLAAAQASSISTVSNTTGNDINDVSQTIGHEPNIMSVIFSLLFVILLIYLTGIIYAKLNKVGFKTMKSQIGEFDKSKVAVISTTPLGSNKTLHVVELDGKRMLIGASANSIDLIKDLGTYPPVDINEGEFSKIEIPNIRIPKIEIPKIEFPNIGFTKTTEKTVIKEEKENNNSDTENESFDISDIYEESPDGIIDKLFTPSEENLNKGNAETDNKSSVHKIDPDEYALYKKYL